eukprot:TRINITY_DN360_c14_g1_i1.p1 TRINITY_DN360_c14_g1~~TRINITY_DN360_c14_g1_i1.p1  ORF type:complete len:363 (-),score=116.14 TRINITY_DN360_c14_g1_i1:60-1034(-)
MGTNDSIKEISKAMDSWISKKREKDLMESLNLDSSFNYIPDISSIDSLSNAQNKTPSALVSLSRFNFSSTIKEAASAGGSGSDKVPTKTPKKNDKGKDSSIQLPGNNNGKGGVSTTTTAATATNNTTTPANTTASINVVVAPDDIEVGTGKLLGKSLMLKKENFEMLRDTLPLRLRDYNWQCIFTTTQHGYNINTFFSVVAEAGPTILLIEDTNGHVFGGFASEEWRSSSTDLFYGTGESYVFTVKPNFAVYKWTRANDFFMHSSRSCIAMGGGTQGRYAFFIDGDLNYGTSEVSNTFLNRRLSSSEEFTCTVLEVWSFTNQES